MTRVIHDKDVFAAFYAGIKLAIFANYKRVANTETIPAEHRKTLTTNALAIAKNHWPIYAESHGLNREPWKREPDRLKKGADDNERL